MRRQNSFRIIGGRHRGRRFSFPEGEIRPSPDRVRETLFNWLQGEIEAARCLDLFAGSGAIGLEAISRGAREVWFVDRAGANLRAIETHLELLRENGKGQLFVADALKFLDTRPAEPFHIVFLDPPYAAGLLEPVATRLEANGWLAPGAAIYLESSAKSPPRELPANWHVFREKTAGDVAYRLARRA